MEPIISYNDFNSVILDLLKTNSPSKRITILNEWLFNKHYDKSEIAIVFQYLEFQRSEKAKQGAIGGSEPKIKAKEKEVANGVLINVLNGLMDVIEANKTAPVIQAPAKPVRSLKTGTDYKHPLWVKTCTGVFCDECGAVIDGCAFRWKRNGEYTSYHPTCIPIEHQATFENVKGYRTHFCLDEKSN